MITLIFAFGAVSIGCVFGRPSNADIKQAIIAYKGDAYLTSDDIEIIKIFTVRILQGRGGTTVKFYPVRVRIKGQEIPFILSQDANGVWIARETQ